MLLPLSHALAASLVGHLSRAVLAHLWWPKHLQVEQLVLLLARRGVVEPTTGAVLDALLEGKKRKVFFYKRVKCTLGPQTCLGVLDRSINLENAFVAQ